MNLCHHPEGGTTETNGQHSTAASSTPPRACCLHNRCAQGQKHAHTQPPGAATLRYLGRLTQPHAWDAGGPGLSRMLLDQPPSRTRTTYARQLRTGVDVAHTAWRLSWSGLQTASRHSSTHTHIRRHPPLLRHPPPPLGHASVRGPDKTLTEADSSVTRRHVSCPREPAREDCMKPGRPGNAGRVSTPTDYPYLPRLSETPTRPSTSFAEEHSTIECVPGPPMRLQALKNHLGCKSAPAPAHMRDRSLSARS